MYMGEDNMDYKIYIAKKINEYINLSIEEIESMLEVPVKYENGDYSLPCFHLSKILKKPPNLIAKELKKQIKDDIFEKIENLGPDLNFFLNKGIYIRNTLERVIQQGEAFGYSCMGEGKIICIEHLFCKKSGCFDISNPFTIVVGNSLCNLFRNRGFKVIDINNISKIWSEVDKLILTQFDYENTFFNYEVDLYYNELISKLRKKNLLIKFNETYVVNLENYNMPPYIVSNEYKIDKKVLKIADLLHINSKYNFYKYLYISSNSEKVNVNQKFKVLELLDYEWVKQCEHVKLGLVKFAKSDTFIKNEKYLNFNELLSNSCNEIMENHIELKKDKGLLKAILQSALVFTYLSDYRIGNKIIDFNKIFSTEYKTGAYIIYSYIKLKSMLLKFENLNCNCNYSKLNFKEGLELVKLLDVYEYFIQTATDELEPAIISRYIIKITDSVNEISNSIFDLENEKLIKPKLQLIKATNIVIKNALRLLGIYID